MCRKAKISSSRLKGIKYVYPWHIVVGKKEYEGVCCRGTSSLDLVVLIEKTMMTPHISLFFH
jgi:hypothetical protein